MIIRLTDDIYRGRRPTRELLLAAEPNPRTLLNLESGWYERLNPGVLKAHELASELGMVQLRLPMSPLKPPSLAQVVEAYEMMNSLDVPRPLLVHCREGVDRTGVVCAYYRVVAEGWSPADAMQEMLSLGFHRWRYLYWLPQIRRLLERAQNGDRR
ncbi:MAG TPA: tyrosine-protein phosphatase [Pirellulales bacterium]|nr:tyrosine-protein phosphatase [Pirellulales bacterium]